MFTPQDLLRISAMVVVVVVVLFCFVLFCFVSNSTSNENMFKALCSDLKCNNLNFLTVENFFELILRAGRLKFDSWRSYLALTWYFGRFSLLFCLFT